MYVQVIPISVHFDKIKSDRPITANCPTATTCVILFILRQMSTYVLKNIARRFRKITESDYQLCHVYLSVCPRGTTRLSPTDFHEI